MADDFEQILAKWDSIFVTTVDPTRERRLEAILEVLAPLLDGSPSFLDLGTGPGPLAQRLLLRFPRCQVVGVDSDPVLLQVGEHALKRFGRRVSWRLANYSHKSWSNGLPELSFDAAVSSLALHWLEEHELRGLYRDLRRLLKPGGLLVNGDFLPSESTENAEGGSGTGRDGELGDVNMESRVEAFKPMWEAWWRALQEESFMRPAFAERQVLMPGPIPPKRTSGPRTPVTVEAHERCLTLAGFRDIEVRWRDHGFGVLVATK